MQTKHPTKPPDINSGDRVIIAAFDDVPENDFEVDEVHEDCITGVALTGLLTGCYGIRDILYQHEDAFIDWRHLHEAKKSMMFDQSAFEATLEMVLREFGKRYRVFPNLPAWPFE